MKIIDFGLAATYDCHEHSLSSKKAWLPPEVFLKVEKHRINSSFDCWGIAYNMYKVYFKEVLKVEKRGKKVTYNMP